jgi:hypothetical protein
MQGLPIYPKITNCPECGQDIATYLTKLVDLSALEKAKHHTYPLVVQVMALNLLSNLGASYEVARKVFVCLREYLPNLERVPSIGSLHAWNMKRNKAMLSPPATGVLEGNYALITDISMSVGKRRLLIFVALCLDEWTFNRPLCISDVRVVGVFVEPTFSGEDVAQCISKVRQQHPEMNVEYLVSDGGGELTKGARLCGLPRVSDCHHFFAKELKKEYEKREDYKAFMTAVIDFNRKNNMNDNAALLPPRLGHHSRFMNVGLLARWATRFLNWPEVVKEQPELVGFIKATKWLEEHRAIIEELVEVTQMGYSMLKVLKHKGLSEATQANCLEMINDSSVSKAIKTRYRSYFEQQTFTALGQLPLAQRSSPLICSSDVIESYFGVLKHRTGKRLNGRCLDIIHYANTSITFAKVREVMEKSTIADATIWHRETLQCKVDVDKRRLKSIFKT